VREKYLALVVFLLLGSGLQVVMDLELKKIHAVFFTPKLWLLTPLARFGSLLSLA
jgi:uncharacterized membrane protein